VHGSAYEFFRNNNLDAKNLLSAPGFNTLRFNQFGGTVGGPIRKEKSFYFLGYEGQRRAESPLYSSFILHCINATGCLEVFSTPFPETSWQIAWLHSLFGNAPAVASGVAAALKAMGRKELRSHVHAARRAF